MAHLEPCLIPACKLSPQRVFDQYSFLHKPQVWFIKLYAPWCGHCKRLAPTWAELAEGFADSDTIGIASVDCTQHKPVCDKAKIKGFPTLQVYHGGEAKEEYHGARTLEALREYVVGQKRKFLDLTEA